MVEQEDVGAGERVETGGTRDSARGEPRPRGGERQAEEEDVRGWRQEVAALEDRWRRGGALERAKDAVEAGVRASRRK